MSLGRWVAAVVGVALPLAALAAVAPPWRLELSGWDNWYADGYPPDFAVIPKHLVIGTGCWTWTTAVTIPAGGDKTVDSQGATLHAALNDVLAETGGGPERFFAFGIPNVDFERHLISIRQAVRTPGVRSVIYINNPGSLQAFTNPANAAAVLPVLDAIAAEHPRLAADIATYRTALLASRGFAEAKPAPWWEDYATWADTVQRRWQGWREGLSYTPFADKRRHQEAEALFAQALAHYGTPATCNAPARRSIKPAQYWIGAGGDAVWQAWLRIAAGMAAERGVRFVWYVPPHLNLAPGEYEAAFKPFFVDRVRAVLADIPGAVVVDHAVGTTLSPCDQVYDPVGRFATGYLFNFPGKLKQARLLLAELAGRGVVTTDPSRLAGPTRWEAALPDLPQAQRWLSEAQSDAAEVREELLSQGEWRRSRPAAEEVGR
jgi:hypothetical protein